MPNYIPKLNKKAPVSQKANKGKDSFLRVKSRELSSPLHVIKGYTEPNRSSGLGKTAGGITHSATDAQQPIAGASKYGQRHIASHDKCGA
jgi:signal transduction histidine kinase